MFQTNSFYPKLILPTRFSSKSCTLIDQIFCKTTNATRSASANIIISDISDHLPYYISITKLKSNQSNMKYIKVRQNSIKAMQGFCDALDKANIINAFNSDLTLDPNVNFNILENMLTKLYEQHFSLKTVRYEKYKHKKENWITTGILHSIKYRDKMDRKLKQTAPTDADFSILSVNLSVYKKILNKTIRNEKRSYYSSLFEKSKTSAKDTWAAIKMIMNSNSNQTKLPKYFQIYDMRVVDKKVNANQFNDFFVNIGSKLAQTIPNVDTPKTVNSYLTNKTSSAFKFKLITEEDIFKIISKLDSKNSAGYDQISSTLLKRINEYIHKPLTLIVNQSLSSGIFPIKLKIAKVIPIFKKDNVHLLNNYRPISLLPTISKVFEKVVQEQLTEFVNINKLLYNSQYGFRKAHSTETATLELIDTLLQALDKKEIPISIFLDLSKAFDTIDHNILYIKLRHYGINGVPLNWLINYLTDRQKIVKLDVEISNTLPISTGVPQGSILGPLLFILYINDLHMASHKFKALLYADDTTLVSTVSAFKQNAGAPDCKLLSDNINYELTRINEWLALNKLKLNINKTKYIIFHFPQRNMAFLDLELKLCGQHIECVRQFVFLGITIHETLNWDRYIDKIANKISRTLGVMNKLKHFLPKYTLKIMYSSLIAPHFNTHRLIKLQKRAIRIIADSKCNSHTEPLLKSLNILKINDIFTIQCLKFFHNYINDRVPVFFRSFFVEHALYHDYETRHCHNICIPHSHTTKARKCIRYHIPMLLNMLPAQLTAKLYTHSQIGLVNYTKQLLLNKYSNTCLIENCYVCRCVET